MDDTYFSRRSRCGSNVESITIKKHYHIDLFYIVVDMKLKEINNHFNETNSRLLICMSCFNPTNLFSSFDKEKLVKFGKFYPWEFYQTSLLLLDNQLETYIPDMRSSIEFASLNGIGDLSKKLVETRRHVVYLLVHQLLKLAVIFPVSTATIKQSFSAMKIVKTRLRNRMGDEWMNGCLVTYIESDVLKYIDNEQIIQRFQNMKSRKGQL
ncbi:unnamed protein product [Lathyrus sativus]|nr:unnamed protein product [Lathyrus sativus]